MNSTTRTMLAGALMLAAGLAAGWWLAQSRQAASHGSGAAAGASARADAAQAAGVASAPGARRVLYWHDPMVPGQRFDKPGKSPFMDMDLVPKYADEDAGAAAGGVRVSPQAQQSLGLRVATAARRAVTSSIDAVGTVGLDERDVSIVQARADGFVERVYARAPGDVIGAGAPLADLLLPGWLAAQQEFLAVRATGDEALTAAARQRLLLLGMAPALVEQVAASGRPQAVQTVTAPSGGLIAELMVRRGMTVAAGMTLARINGLATVWVEVAVPEALGATVAPGQDAEVRPAALPGQVLRGRVAAVLPEANRDTRTLRVRIELPNPGQRLRAGMFTQVTLRGAPQGEAVVVPIESVVRTGRRALVYLVEDDGRFRPVEVELGAEVGDAIVVLRGIDAGQKVVASGQFLIDSEASLLGVRPGAPGPAAAPSVPASAPARAAAVAEDPHAAHRAAASPASGARP